MLFNKNLWKRLDYPLDLGLVCCFLFLTILLPLKSYFYKIYFTRNVIFIWWKQLKGDLLPVCTLCLDSDLYTYTVSYIHLLGFIIRKRTLDFFQVFFFFLPFSTDWPKSQTIPWTFVSLHEASLTQWYWLGAGQNKRRTSCLTPKTKQSWVWTA